MKTFPATIALTLLAVAPALAADTASKTAPTRSDAVFVTPAEIKWSDPPPVLPKNAKMGVLHGDPTKAAQYTVRLKMPAGYKIPPHWHTNDEALTILSGALMLHMGDAMDAPAHKLEAGAFHFLPGKMHHAAETKVETIVQIDAMGPFDIHYLNPADDPSKTATATLPAPAKK